MNDVQLGIYKHYKGKFILVICTAKHSDREEIEVVYKGLNDGVFFARPIESFNEVIEDEKGNKIPRFELATEEELKNLLSLNLIDDQILEKFNKK